jgi:hypothetical protein
MKMEGIITAAEFKDGGIYLCLDGRPVQKHKDKDWTDDPINIVIVASKRNCLTYWLGRKVSITLEPL